MEEDSTHVKTIEEISVTKKTLLSRYCRFGTRVPYHGTLEIWKEDINIQNLQELLNVVREILWH